jgi:hypothetical protein
MRQSYQHHPRDVQVRESGTLRHERAGARHPRGRSCVAAPEQVADGGHLEEAAAYLAEALFFERKGESIIEDWEEDNQWAFNLKHIGDPIQANPKARIYAAAEQVIEKFDMDVKPVSLTAADVSDLLVAIAKDAGYAEPKPVKPRPPKPDHPATFRERWRARRERRRARWAH